VLVNADAYPNDRPYDRYWKDVQDDRRLLERRCLVILSELPFEIDGDAAVITAAPKIAQLPNGFAFGDLDGFCGLKPTLAEASGLKELRRGWTKGWKKAKKKRLAEEKEKKEEKRGVPKEKKEKKEGPLSSLYRGACWVASKKKWVATTGYNNKKHHIGYFKDQHE
jgi:hypothetical protein